MSPDTMQNWMIALMLIVGCLVGTIIIRFVIRWNDRHLRRLADAEANRNLPADDI